MAVYQPGHDDGVLGINGLPENRLGHAGFLLDGPILLMRSLWIKNTGIVDRYF
jgi:hypothetical protein